MTPPEVDPELAEPVVGYLPTIGEGDPCEWPIIPQENSHVGAIDYYDMAVEYLWRWTRGVFGLCEVSIRPCRGDCHGFSTFWGNGPFPWPGGSSSGNQFGPALIGGVWLNLGCRRCGTRSCHCEALEGLTLPGPVAGVVEVLVDGLVVDPTAYRVTNRRYLLRVDGDSWPICQDLTAEPTEDNTFEVTYLRGVAVPQGGQVAAGILANQFALAASNDAACQLPKRIQTVTRQGVTVAMIDSFDNVNQGFTGIWLIDAWVQSVISPPKPSRVMSPDYGFPGHVSL